MLLALLRRRPDPDELALAHHLVDHSRPRRADAVRRASAGSEAAACSSCPTPAAPSAATGRRATCRRCASRAPSWPRGCAASWRPRSATHVPADAQRPAAQRRAWTRRSSPRSPRRALPGLQAIAAAFPPSPSSTRPRGRAGWPTTPASPLTTVPIEQPRAARRGRGLPARLGSCRCRCPGIVIEAPLIAAARRLGAGGRARRPGRRRALRRRALPHRRPRAASATAVGMAAGAPAPVARQPIRRCATSGASSRASACAARCRPACTSASAAGARPRATRPPGCVPASRGSTATPRIPWRWKRLDGPRWWASLADTLTRGRETADLADYLRRRGAHGRRGGALAAARRAASSSSPCACRPRRTSIRSRRDRSCARRCAARCRPTCSRAATSATSRRCTTATLQTTDNLERVRRLLDERSAAVGAYVDLGRLHRDHLDRPPAVGEPVGGRGRCTSGTWSPPSCGCAADATDVDSDPCQSARRRV